MQRSAPLQRRVAPSLPASVAAAVAAVAGTHNFYYYAADFTGSNAVASGGGSRSRQVVIDDDAEFEWMQSTFWSVGSAGENQTVATRVLPNALVNISTQDTQRIGNVPLPIPAWFGDGAQPFVLPRARRFKRRTQLLFEVTNNDPDDALSLYLVMLGQKVYA